MHILMSKGSVGDDVERLRRTLANALGGDAELFPSLKKANTPILGLDRIHDEAYSGWDGSSDTGEALALWRPAPAAPSPRARSASARRAAARAESLRGTVPRGRDGRRRSPCTPR